MRETVGVRLQTEDKEHYLGGRDWICAAVSRNAMIRGMPAATRSWWILPWCNTCEFLTSDLWNYERINCCFKLLNLWQFVSAAIGS